MLEHHAMQQFPESDDPLVQALQRLLEREGGHIAVGDAAGINDQSLYQIASCRTDSKTGKVKGVGPSIRARLSKQFPGWLDPSPSTAGVARTVSFSEFTVPDTISWESVLSQKELPAMFTLEVPDGAMSPDVLKGESFIFSRAAKPKPEIPVLVEDADGRRHVRQYAQTPGDAWEARASAKGYASFSSSEHGLVLLAVAVWRSLADD